MTRSAEIPYGSKWRHTRDGYDVHIPATPISFKVKDENDAEWGPAVLYVRNDEPDVAYARSHDDFLAKFEAAPDDDSA